MVDLARRVRRPDLRRALLRRDGRAVPAGGLGLPVVQADRQAVHRLLIERLDPDRGLDRHAGRGGGRLAGRRAADLDRCSRSSAALRTSDQVATPDGAKNALLLGRGPGGLHHHHQHGRGQGHGPDQQLRRRRGADRRHAAVILLAATSAAARASSSTPSTSAGAIRWGYFGAFLVGRADERVRDVRVRHGRDAGRGDASTRGRTPRPRSSARWPRPRLGGLPGHLVRRDGHTEHPRLATRYLRAALPGQGQRSAARSATCS